MRLTTTFVLALSLLMPDRAHAQTPNPSSASDGPLFIVDFNLVATAAHVEQSRRFTSFFLSSSELGVMRVTYPKPSSTRPGFEAGGSLQWHRWGFGLSYSHTTFDDTAAVSISIPHPFFFGVPAAAEGPTDSLQRQEDALHFFGVLAPFRRPRLLVRVFGGPSLFILRAEMVSDVTYSQLAGETNPQNTVLITGTPNEKRTQAGIGMHAGADFTYFITRRIGIDAGFRYSTGRVNLTPEPMSGLTQAIRVGGAQMFVGGRFVVGK